MCVCLRENNILAVLISLEDKTPVKDPSPGTVFELKFNSHILLLQRPRYINLEEPRKNITIT